MGIHKNLYVKPKLYHKANDEISSNQKSFKLNYLQEYLERQTELNHSLTASVEDVHKSIRQNTQSQNNQLDLMLNRLGQQEKYAEELLQVLQQQEQTNEILLKKINLLEKSQEAVIEKLETDGLLTQAILDQQALQEAALTKITSNLSEHETLTTQLQKHEEIYEDFSKKLEVQEIYHNTVMERLDQQEGLIKRLSTELDHLRSILYERASHIVEKFEAGMNRVTKPIQRFFVNFDEREKEKVEK